MQERLYRDFGEGACNTNLTYVLCADLFDEILKTHANFINSVGLEMSEEDKNLPYLYWTPKLHETPL